MTLPALSQSPREGAFVQDPYPFYATARAAGPLVHWTDYGFPVATDFATVNAILRDRRFGRENPAPPPVPAHLEPFYRYDRLSMLDREPPAHTRLRSLVLRAFTPRRIEALGPQIAALADTLAAGLGDGDLITGFAERLPATVIARLIGVPDALVPDLLGWSHAMVAMYQARRDRAVEDAAVAATEAFADCLRDVIAARRRTPCDDLLTHLITARDAGDRLSEDEVIATAMLLLNAGHEATVHTIGNGVLALLRSGRPFGAAVNAAPPAALAEEILRFDPPLHLFTRFALEDLSLHGHRFARGDSVGLLLASAGRDAARIEDADIFTPDRPTAPHLALGAGLHFCLGAPLARLELSLALPALARHWPALTLAAEPRFADRYHFRGLEALELTLSG